jgi:hypothetical protein
MPVAAGSVLAAGAVCAPPRLPPAAAAPLASPGYPLASPAGAGRPSLRGGLSATVSSTNWSGYAVARGRGAFRSVSASWVEPAPGCAAGGGIRYAAFWVGLDGYHNHSVEQAGTDSDCRGPTARYYGWYEMYPAGPVTLGDRVRPGDQISASVTFSGAQTYTLVLRDSTEGWTRTVVRNEAGLARSSAEVITEAPSSRAGVLPLADFRRVRFTASRVNGRPLRALAPTKIIMTGRGGVDKALASQISRAGAFSTVWLRSG